MLLGLLEVLLVVREQAQVLADQRRRGSLLPLVRCEDFQGAIEFFPAAPVILVEQIRVGQRHQSGHQRHAFDGRRVDRQERFRGRGGVLRDARPEIRVVQRRQQRHDLRGNQTVS